jgi:succinate dehydrogenase / fumarate reductase cytochrome b subunit
MNLISRTWRSTLGRKYVMALSGAALFAFVIGHLAGNLQVLGAPDLINTYAHFLKSKPGLLWGARLGLLACVGLHIAAAISLHLENKAARPQPYAAPPSYGSTTASRTMIVSGLVILAFVIYHLAHFTVLLPGVNGVGDFRKLTTVLHGEPVADVYAMMVLGFQVWWVVLFYLIAQGLLFMHLGHGVAAMFQSLGWRDHVWWPRISCFARGASCAIFLGYAIIPLAIFLRIVGADYAANARHQVTAATPGAATPTVTVTAAAPAPGVSIDNPPR